MPFARSRHPPKQSPKMPEEHWPGSLCSQAVTFRSKVDNKTYMYCSSYFIRRSSLRCLISAHPFGARSRVAVLYFFPSPPFPSPSRLRRRDVRGAPKVDDDVVLWSSITAAAVATPPGSAAKVAHFANIFVVVKLHRKEEKSRALRSGEIHSAQRMGSKSC